MIVKKLEFNFSEDSVDFSDKQTDVLNKNNPIFELDDLDEVKEVDYDSLEKDAVIVKANKNFLDLIKGSSGDSLEVNSLSLIDIEEEGLNAKVSNKFINALKTDSFIKKKAAIPRGITNLKRDKLSVIANNKFLNGLKDNSSLNLIKFPSEQKINLDRIIRQKIIRTTKFLNDSSFFNINDLIKISDLFSIIKKDYSFFLSNDNLDFIFNFPEIKENILGLSDKNKLIFGRVNSFSDSINDILDLAVVKLNKFSLAEKKRPSFMFINNIFLKIKNNLNTDDLILSNIALSLLDKFLKAIDNLDQKPQSLFKLSINYNKFINASTKGLVNDEILLKFFGKFRFQKIKLSKNSYISLSKFISNHIKSNNYQKTLLLDRKTAEVSNLLKPSSLISLIDNRISDDFSILKKINLDLNSFSLESFDSLFQFENELNYLNNRLLSRSFINDLDNISFNLDNIVILSEFNKIKGKALNSIIAKLVAYANSLLENLDLSVSSNSDETKKLLEKFLKIIKGLGKDSFSLIESKLSRKSIDQKFLDELNDSNNRIKTLNILWSEVIFLAKVSKSNKKIEI